MKNVFQSSIALLTSGLMACGVLAPHDCTADARAAVSVAVHDSVSGAAAGQGARIIARDGAYADTADFTAYDGPYGLARERPGTYTVTVEQEGYRLWTWSGVRVRRDECHVRTVSLTARLQR